MVPHTAGFAPETFITIIIRLMMIATFCAVGIYVIRNGFNSTENDNS